MRGKYWKKIGGFILAALMLSGIVFVSPTPVDAQSRHGRRVIIVRPYRPFGWGHRWGYNRYDPWGPYGYRYSQYVFDNSEKAVNSGYKQGFKTGRDDGKKAKSFSYERSHYFQEAGFGNFGDAYRNGFTNGYQEGYREGSNQRAS
jgi:hypothetical protein